MKCKWSQNSFCQIMVFKHTDTKVGCEGRYAACLPSKNLDLEDIRFRQHQAKVDNGAWWVEDGVLHLDLPRLLKNCGLPDTEANRDLAVKIVLEVAAKELPRSPVTVIEQGAGQ